MNKLKNVDVCVLIANSRSRSTYFLDFIRTLECVGMEKEYAIFKRLFLRGRRYPLDLADIVQDDMFDVIEMAPNHYQKIPRIVINHDIKYYVEKIHPHFIRLPYILFLALLKFRFNGYKLIYLVRDPESSLRSYLKYCYRNPKWGANRKVPDFITKQYKCIFNLYQILGGEVFDSNDLNSLWDVSCRLGEYLNIENHDVKRHIDNFMIYNESMYELRKGRSPFVSDDDMKIDLSKYASELDEARFFYKKLLVNNYHKCQ